jgi:hypothetical protein
LVSLNGRPGLEPNVTSIGALAANATPHSTFVRSLLLLVGWKGARHIERSCANDVTMIGAERPDAKAEVTLGVDTHTLTPTWRWPWTIFWADAWAS